MTLLHLDSWGMTTEASADPAEMHVYTPGSSPAFLSTPRYAGSPAQVLRPGHNTVNLWYRLPAGVTFPLYYGFAASLNAGQTGRNQWGMGLGAIRGLGAATTGGINSTWGLLTANRGLVLCERNGLAGSTLLSGPSAPVWEADQGWHWVEVCHDLTLGHGNGCTTTVRVDGVEVGSAAGHTYNYTSAGGDNSELTAYQWLYFGSDNINDGYGDWFNIPPLTDLYICDSAGAAPFNTWLGEIQIQGRAPTGDDATYQEWTPSSAGAHYSRVDEVPPNDDTDHVQAAVSKRDLYSFPALTGSVNVLAVKAQSWGRLIDPYGSHYQDVIVRRAGADGNASATVLQNNRLLPRFLTSSAYMTTDPTDSSAWTQAKVDAATFGPRRA